VITSSGRTNLRQIWGQKISPRAAGDREKAGKLKAEREKDQKKRYHQAGLRICQDHHRQGGRSKGRRPFISKGYDDAEGLSESTKTELSQGNSEAPALASEKGGTGKTAKQSDPESCLNTTDQA